MSKPNMPSLLDLVRLSRPTLAESIDAMAEHLLRPPPAVSYQRARSLVRQALSHSAPWTALSAACDAAKRLAERPMTAEVIRLVWQLGEGRSIQSYKLTDKRLTVPDGRFRLRRDVMVSVPVDFLYVENKSTTFFWAQFRKTYALSDIQIAVLAAVFKRAYLDECDDPADLEIFDLSAPVGSKRRDPRLLRIADFPAMPESTIVDVLQRSIDAFDAICARDIDWSEARASRRSTPTEKANSDQSSFF